MKQKYIVAPVTRNGDDGPGSVGPALHESEYFVLKLSDPFAIGALYSYAHSIGNILAIDSGRDVLTAEERTHLLDLADQAFELAASWEGQGTALGRVPS